MEDKFNRNINYLRISITDFCNLRCHYCMPEEGIEAKSHNDILSYEEIVLATKVAASLGVNKIRVTGGEPLVRKDVVQLCKRIKEIDGINELCITTNGILLPKFAKQLVEAGVDRVNISLDTLDPKKYHFITRVGELKDAINGIETAIDSGFKKVKINTVLIGGFNDDEIEDLAKLTYKYPIDVRFIELMPMPGAEYSKASFISNDTILKKLPELEKVEFEGVADMYKLPNAKGKIGLISALSHLFCNSCNRLRLTSDGKLKPCLHSVEEISIKDLSEEKMREQFLKAIASKPKQHDELSNDSSSKSARSMNRIGG